MRRIIDGALILVSFFLSCSVPFYERAKITKGFSGGIGLGVGSGRTVSGSTYPGPPFLPTFDYYMGGLGNIFLRYGFSEYFLLFFQGSAGTGLWLTGPGGNVTTEKIPKLLDAQLGVKFRTGENDAIRLNIGYPSLLDFVYLHDFNSYLTGNIGLGARGLGVGIVKHNKISEMVIGHTSLNLLTGWEFFRGCPFRFIPAISLGFGIEVLNNKATN